MSKVISHSGRILIFQPVIYFFSFCVLVLSGDGVVVGEDDVAVGVFF